jgi:CRISPR-associated protein Cmr5
MSQQQTLQQRRAAAAWADIQGVANTHHKGEYGSLVRGLPAMIQKDGLGHTLAFLQAKKGNHHLDLDGHVSKWVMTEFKTGQRDLLEWLLKASSADYRRATTEAMAYLMWLKRFAEAQDWK